MVISTHSVIFPVPVKVKTQSGSLPALLTKTTAQFCSHCTQGHSHSIWPCAFLSLFYEQPFFHALWAARPHSDMGKYPGAGAKALCGQHEATPLRIPSPWNYNTQWQTKLGCHSQKYCLPASDLPEFQGAPILALGEE